MISGRRFPILPLRRFAAPGGRCHIARHRIGPGVPGHIHSHDFVELFWVEHGGGRHRIAGVEYTVSAGDICFVRPEDVHGLGGDPGGLTFVNLAIDSAVATELAVRYGGPGDLWSGGPTARRRHLAPAALRRLGELVDPLTRAWGGDGERLALDRFLLELVDALAQGAAAAPGPPWLQRALATLAAEPRLLADGAVALRTLSGRSREHLARSVRRHLGVSPRELLLGLRLDQAARALRMGDAPILPLALDAGFANLSYFHRCFRGRFGCTPRAYRRLHRQPAAGAV